VNKIVEEELKPSRAYHKIEPFVVSKDEWDTKEGPSMSFLCTAAWQKAPLGLKRRQTAKKSSP